VRKKDHFAKENVVRKGRSSVTIRKGRGSRGSEREKIGRPEADGRENMPLSTYRKRREGGNYHNLWEKGISNGGNIS